ncbi:MAG: hypothetical protein VW802_02800 [Rhodospirillaceae bacterium]|jgi:hypothetical protein
MNDQIIKSANEKVTAKKVSVGRPSKSQRQWLIRGLKEPGGKLPLFDHEGQRVSERTVRSCVEKGWAEPWFDNPIKPDWTICRLTDLGRQTLNDNE